MNINSALSKKRKEVVAGVTSKNALLLYCNYMYIGRLKKAPWREIWKDECRLTS